MLLPPSLLPLLQVHTLDQPPRPDLYGLDAAFIRSSADEPPCMLPGAAEQPRDLAYVQQVRVCRGVGGLVTVVSCHWRHVSARQAGLDERLDLGRDPAIVLPGAQGNVPHDRKSTRLNSSHITISY